MSDKRRPSAAARVEISAGPSAQTFDDVAAFVLIDLNGMVSFACMPEIEESDVVRALRAIASKIEQKGEDAWVAGR